MYTLMFITALFIIARSWKQPRCPSADEWMRKLWYICTMEYYSAIKKKVFELVLMRWMKLEPIIHSESEIAQSCPTLLDPWTVANQAPPSMGILQARILEWVAISFSRGSSRPRDPTLQADALNSTPPGKPYTE